MQRLELDNSSSDRRGDSGARTSDSERPTLRRVAATLTAIFAVLFSGPLLTQTTSVQYVKLEALAEMNGNPWSSMAEFNLLDAGPMDSSRPATT